MTAAELLDSGRPLVIAHRGDSRAAPENTLPAFASALKRRVDVVELDYLHSADDVPVVFHDTDLDRVTDACRVWGGQKIPLAGKTLAELRQLDGGAWFAPEFAGTRLSTLEEALLLIGDRATTMIERKSGDATTCVELLQRLDAVDRVVVTSFDWDFLADCRRLNADLALGALGDVSLTPAHLDRAEQFGARVMGWGDAVVTHEHFRAVRDRGLSAWVWTVDDPARATTLLGWGATGIISNVPGAIQQVMADLQPG